MIPGRQMGKSRAVARAVAKNAGLDLEEFDRLWDKYENNILEIEAHNPIKITIISKLIFPLLPF